MASQFSPPPPPPPASNPFTSAPLPKHSLTQNELSLPSAKRPRLSPGPGQFNPTPFPSSPFSTPGANSPITPSLALPIGPSTNIPTYSFNTPQPYQSQQPSQQQNQHVKFASAVMGPPERPAQRPARDETVEGKNTDPNDLTDIVTASGIDLREEENYLMHSYRNRTNEANSTTAFGGQPASSAAPHGNFHTWAQSNLGSQPAFQGHGPISSPPRTQQSIEEEAEAKLRRAARAHAESRARELNDPFLKAGNIRNKLQQKTYQSQIRFSADGRPGATDLPKYYGSVMTGSDGIGVVQAHGSGLVHAGSPIEHLLALLSIATKERLRGILEDSIGVARSRRYGSHGLVPPDFASIATGEGQQQDAVAQPESITGTAWDRTAEGAASPNGQHLTAAQKSVPKPTAMRLDQEPASLPTPPSSEMQSQATIQFKPSIPLVLRQIGQAERKAEEARLAARKKRQAAAAKDPTLSAADAALASLNSPDTPGGGGASGTATPTTEGKITKKDREAAKKAAHQTDSVLAASANTAAAMALGGSKKYSWMTGGSSGGGARSGFGTGAGAGRGVGSRAPSSATVPTAGGGAVKAQEDQALASKGGWKKFGDFREDGRGGTKIQVRDLVIVLERDGNGAEGKSLVKALQKMSSEKEVT